MDSSDFLIKRSPEDLGNVDFYVVSVNIFLTDNFNVVSELFSHSGGVFSI